MDSEYKRLLSRKAHILEAMEVVQRMGKDDPLLEHWRDAEGEGMMELVSDVRVDGPGVTSKHRSMSKGDIMSKEIPLLGVE